MLSPDDLIAALSDGHFKSGQDLADRFQVSRAAVCKGIRRLLELGVPIDAVRGRGYRLRHPFEPLDEGVIRDALATRYSMITEVEVFQVLDSTNRHLMEQARGGAAGPRVCLAESQRAGRGRRGRAWCSPFGANLYLSLYWVFDLPASALGALGLVAGVSVARALETLGLRGHGLKWPNDLLWQGRKLGGVLIELASCEAEGPCRAVLGVGLNITMSDLYPKPEIDQPWVDLITAHPGLGASRNRVAIAVLEELIESLQRFPLSGLTGVGDDWRRFDLVTGREVELRTGHETICGRAVGVDSQGYLLVHTQGGVRPFASGEVSLRLST